MTRLIRWLEREFGLISDGSHRVLTNDGGLASWAKSTHPSGGFLSTLEYLGEAKMDGLISSQDYVNITSSIQSRIDENYSEAARSLLLSTDDLNALDEATVSSNANVPHGSAISGKSFAAIVGVAEILRHAGHAGDALGLAVTVAHASELQAKGDANGAQDVWAGYIGDVAGGSVGAVGGGAVAAALIAVFIPEPSSTAVGISVLVGAIVGGVIGGQAGEDFAVALTDHFQEKLADGEEIKVSDITRVFEEFVSDNEIVVDGYLAPSNGNLVLYDKDECFMAGTPISMFDGTVKLIEEVEVGDIVASYERDGKLTDNKVVRLFRNEVQHLLDVHGLKVTPGHMTYCGDGALVKGDGSIVRVAINKLVGSTEDQFVEVMYARTAEEAAGQAGQLQECSQAIIAGNAAANRGKFVENFALAAMLGGQGLMTGGLAAGGNDQPNPRRLARGGFLTGAAVRHAASIAPIYVASEYILSGFHFARGGEIEAAANNVVAGASVPASAIPAGRAANILSKGNN